MILLQVPPPRTASSTAVRDGRVVADYGVVFGAQGIQMWGE